VLFDLAAAQTIESFEWVEGGGAAVARITFAGNVRYLRQAPAQSVAADLAQVGFQIVTADEAVLNQVTEEGKRLNAEGVKPRIDLAYSPNAKSQTKLLTLRFADKVLLQARQGPGARTIDLVLGTAARAQGLAADSLPAPADKPQDQRFTVLLMSTPEGSNVNAPRIPAEFQNYEVFTQASERAGVKGTDLVLGYFKNAQDAQTVMDRAQRVFPGASVQAVASEKVAAAAPQRMPQVEVNVSDVDGQGAALLAKGRQAYDDRQYQQAVDALNQALMLPPNPSTPAAQELIGLTWEALNRPDKARPEYQLYLKLYPDGEAVQRVTQRLANMGGAAVAAVPGQDAQKPKNKASATGSVSQYFYGGNTKTDSLVNIASGVNQNTLTTTNQSVLVSSWDATGRYDTDESITKLVMRGSHSDNLATSSSLSATTQGLVSAAYVDYRHIASRMDWRVGRQSAIGGSLFGLFDGVSMAMPVGDHYKMNAMVGVPANTLVSAPQQNFYGASLEADNLFEHWGGNISLVEQTSEGISDRRAMGLEVRYFGETMSMYSQMDYDLNFNAVNALSLQGSMQGPYDTSITMMVDSRKAPSLQLSDALISTGKSSIKTLLQTMSLDQAQAAALATAADARQAMVSVSRALSEKWQGSFDLRFSEVGALPAVGNFQAQPATGAQYSTSFQLTGSNLYSTRDINGFNVSYITSDTMNGTQLAYNNLTGFMGNKMSLEPNIRYYTQTDNTQTKVTRISPGLRVSYKLSDRANVMAEGIYETSQTDGLTNHETSESYFFYVGYRYDFQ